MNDSLGSGNMLVLWRKIGDTTAVTANGNGDAFMVVVEIRHADAVEKTDAKTRLGVAVPVGWHVHRLEVYQAIIRDDAEMSDELAALEAADPEYLLSLATNERIEFLADEPGTALITVSEIHPNSTMVVVRTTGSWRGLS